MLHILLLVLKIIGIILGVLLGSILLCLCLALFVPVRYRADICRTEEEGAPPVVVTAKITWLLHMVNLRLSYSTEFQMRARIFFITVFRLPKKQKEKGEKKSKKQETKKRSAENETKKREAYEDKERGKRGENGAAIETEENREHTADREIKESRENKTDKEATDNKNQEAAEENAQKKPKVPIGKRIKAIITKIYHFFQNIWYTITGICDKIKKIRENIEYYRNVLQSETFQKSYSLCKEELASVFSHIRPRKFQADLTVGTGDPASTAQILSYYGMLYPLIGGNVNIVPDFDEKRVEGAVLIKGSIRLFTFIKTAIHIYFSKDIRKLLKLFKKEDA